MFNNIGVKIRTLAEVICLIGIIISVIVGLVMMEDSVSGGLAIIVVGALGSWIGSFLLFGFGTLVANSELIVELLWHIKNPEEKSNDADSNE